MLGANSGVLNYEPLSSAQPQVDHLNIRHDHYLDPHCNCRNDSNRVTKKVVSESIYSIKAKNAQIQHFFHLSYSVDQKTGHSKSGHFHVQFSYGPTIHNQPFDHSKSRRVWFQIPTEQLFSCKIQLGTQKVSLSREKYVEISLLNYSGDLNNKLVWYSDHEYLSDHRIVCYS